MQLLKDWPPNRRTPLEKRKRESLELSSAEVGRKKSKGEDDESRRTEPSAGVEDERPSTHSPSPLHTDSPIPSPSRPKFHQQLTRLPSHNDRVFPLSPLSRSPEHCSAEPAADNDHSASSSQSDNAESASALTEASKQFKPFRFDNARAMSANGHRSPGYRRVSQAGKDEYLRQYTGDQTHREASFDSVGQNSDAPSRRQSDTMPPPSSTTVKGLRSGSSAANVNDARSLNSPTKLAKPGEAPLAYDFSGLAQSIALSSSVHVKLDKYTEIANETELENSRKQKYAFAHDSLIDLAKLRYEASQKAKVRLSQQSESLAINQGIIAQKLDARLAQTSVSKAYDAKILDEAHEKGEIVKIRKEVEAAQNDLKDLKRYSLKQADLDSYNRGIAHKEDLADLVKETSFHRMEETIAAQHLDLARIGEKLENIAGTMDEFHRQTQEIQMRNDTRFQGLDTAIKNMQANESRLEKSLESQGESLCLREANLNELQKSIGDLYQTVYGYPGESERGLTDTLKSQSRKVTQTMESIEQLAPKVKFLEDEVQNRNQSHTPQISHSQLDERLAILRQDFESLKEEQKDEYTLLTESIHELELQMAALKNEAVNSNSQDISSRQSHKPAKFDAPINTEGVDRIKLEQLENNLKALDTQVVVQKKQFDNLTTEHLAQNIIHQTKQLYKEHPGHVQDRIRSLEVRLAGIDSYMSQTLEARLGYIRTATDTIPAWTNRIQSLEVNVKHNREYNDQTRKDLSVHANAVKCKMTSQEDAMNTIRQTLLLDYETVTKRLDRRQRDVQFISTDAHNEAATILTGQNSPEKSIPYQDQTKSPEWKEGYSIKGKARRNIEMDETTIRRPRETVITSGREDSVASRVSRTQSFSAEESDAPLVNARRIQQSKRKRKSFSKVSDSEDDHESKVARKAFNRKGT